MSIFNNTFAGECDYSNYGKTVTYTFPKKADIELSGVKLSIADLQVNSYGGRFDTVTGEFLCKLASLLPDKSSNKYNTDIYISDNDISGNGYPTSRKDFENYNIVYLTYDQYENLSKEVNGNANHPKAPLLSTTIKFFRKWAVDNQQLIKEKINTIVSNNRYFPKELSIVYDDRISKHTTHIILNYASPKNCTLVIDNTYSPAYAFLAKRQQELLENGIDLLKCKESISLENPRIINLYKEATDSKETLGYELDRPIDSWMREKVYARMTQILKECLNIPITNIEINRPRYNIKNTDECVPFAIQNKLDFIENKTPPSEIPLEAGTRFRAEHAILAYLLKKTLEIPRFSEQACIDIGVPYPKNVWHPNYQEIAQRIDKEISKLAFLDLSRLFLSIELGDEPTLSPSFKEQLLHHMSLQASLEDYVEIPSFFTEQEAELQQAVVAPRILYNKDTNTLLLSKDVRFKTNLSIRAETEEPDLVKS